MDDRARFADQRIVQVASALRGEGCTTIAIALAVAIAEHARRRVLLLDFDLMQPEIGNRLSLSRRAGLEDVLARDCSLDDVVVSAALPALDVLPLNSVDRCGLAGHPGLSRAMSVLRRSYDLVVVDGGGLLAGRSPSEHIPPGIDSALIVQQPATTSDCLVQHVRAAFAEHAVECLGIIENAASLSSLAA